MNRFAHIEEWGEGVFASVSYPGTDKPFQGILILCTTKQRWSGAKEVTPPPGYVQ